MTRERALKAVMVLVGLLFSAAVYPLTMFLWRWHESEFAPMMLSLYATLGIFLLLAARNPSANRSLIAFTAWSSFAHGAVMAVQVFENRIGRGDSDATFQQARPFAAPFAEQVAVRALTCLMAVRTAECFLLLALRRQRNY
jgi:hypothetical protein